MIISNKNKFIFIKNYKTAGSSIESALFPTLNSMDIIAPTVHYPGINAFGNFDQKTMIHLPELMREKYIEKKWKYFAHMPAWLIKERLGDSIFNNFFKFAILRNPWDLIVSHYKWQNMPNNHNANKQSFDEIINQLPTEHPYSV